MLFNNRARRLFYVICSSAKESLAVVVYTKNVQAVKKLALEKEWFLDNEIVLIEKNEQADLT